MYQNHPDFRSEKFAFHQGGFQPQNKNYPQNVIGRRYSEMNNNVSQRFGQNPMGADFQRNFLNRSEQPQGFYEPDQNGYSQSVQNNRPVSSHNGRGQGSAGGMRGFQRGLPVRKLSEYNPRAPSPNFGGIRAVRSNLNLNSNQRRANTPGLGGQPGFYNHESLNISESLDHPHHLGRHSFTIILALAVWRCFICVLS